MRAEDRKFRLTSCLMAIAFLAILLLSTPYTYAGRGRPPRVIMGTVQAVSYSSILVNGKYYDISGVPILSTRGLRLTKDQVIRGSEVEIRSDGDKITSVIVKYTSYMVQ
jgi:hypothetical protein